MCLVAESNPQEAKSWLVKAIALNPDDAAAILQLLKVSYAIKQFNEVEAALEKYCRHTDCSEDLLFSYAGVLFEQQKYLESKHTCETILRTNPSSKDAQQLANRISEATRNLGSSAAQQPSPTAVNNPIIAAPISLASTVAQTRFDPTPTTEALLAQLEEYRRNMKVEELKAGLIAAEKQSSTFTNGQKQRLHLLAADYQVMNGELEEARKIFQEISKDDPYCTRALCGLGALTANGGNWQEAQRYFSQAVSLDPRQDVAYAGLGLCAKQDNQLERAWGFYRTALSINPENMRALLGLMEIGYPMKRYDDIERALRGYLELHPADTEFSYSLAGCLFAQDRLDAAAETISTILAFKPGDTRAHELSEAIASKRNKPLASNAQR